MRGNFDCCERYWWLWLIIGIVVAIGVILTIVLGSLCGVHMLDTNECRAKMQEMMTTIPPPF